MNINLVQRRHCSIDGILCLRASPGPHRLSHALVPDIQEVSTRNFIPEACSISRGHVSSDSLSSSGLVLIKASNGSPCRLIRVIRKRSISGWTLLPDTVHVVGAGLSASLLEVLICFCTELSSSRVEVSLDAVDRALAAILLKLLLGQLGQPIIATSLRLRIKSTLVGNEASEHLRRQTILLCRLSNERHNGASLSTALSRVAGLLHIAALRLDLIGTPRIPLQIAIHLQLFWRPSISSLIVKLTSILLQDALASEDLWLIVIWNSP